MSQPRRTVRLLSIVLAPLVMMMALLTGYTPSGVLASSHREAPLIARDPYADNTDVYAFISPDRPDSVTLIANYIPLEWPESGPNFFEFDDNVRYEIHVDNVGDARSHITFQFDFDTRTRNPNTFLYNTGPITSLDDEDWNKPQTFTLTQRTARGNGQPSSAVLGRNLRTPPVYVGTKSTPNYEALATAAIHTIGSGANAIKVFAGQRDDPFFADLGAIFDLLSLRGQAPPIGYPSGQDQSNLPQDGLAGYNTHTIAIQVPISRLRASGDDEPVLGVWATASRRSTRVLNGVGGILDGRGAESHTGNFVQVSRLGMPLVNEVVIPLALKDAFNNLRPEQDAGIYTADTDVGNLLQRSVLDPELQRLLKALYNVPNPGANRLDLQAIFLTGLKTTKPFTINTAGGPVELPAGTNVNQPSDVQPAEMLRLNTAAPFRPGVEGSVCAPTPNYQLGLLGGDACGFPNGRRLQDDVVDIELLAVAGAAYSVLTSETFAFNPALIGALRDNVNQNDRQFLSTFPYVSTPWSGTDHRHANVFETNLPQVFTQQPRQSGLREE
ncbi:MAG: hypothetical protein AVDCRST_MAG26-2179 [uncultured Chloroflexia bacterium]|uniref:DUF4331 domain-containing protein n=1 Tax=uncultured Chloroflexia bacterium TaxID=1672391 RepID=A0A6J4ISD3_9CHLR|nr:MAG: hypothetical protein AVDCRST_MAG26-2179 [uncultured Chloroflexia bacterium]